MINDTQLTRKKMVEGQIFTNRVLDKNILSALETIPRENFVPENYKKSAYFDGPIPLDNKRFILEPLAIARMLVAAEISKNDSVLVVDCDMGYTSALVAMLAKNVVAIEEDAELMRRAKNNLVNIKIKNVEVLPAMPSSAFDVIIMNGAVEIIPAQLTGYLKEGGRLVAIKNGFIETIKRHGKIFVHNKGDQEFATTLPDFKKPQGFVF